MSISSATLLVFSFPPFNLSFLAWIALIPLLFLLEELNPKEVFLFYFLSGLTFWLYHIWWLTYVTFLGYSLLVIYLSSLFGFFGLLLKLSRERTQYPLIFLAPPLWVLFEFIRTYLFTGFPWSLLGYSQWRNIPLIQISSITGVYGVSFLIIMINAAIADFIFANPVKNSSQLVKAKKFFYGTKTKKHPRLPPFGRGGQVRNLVFAILIIGCIVVVGKRVISTPLETGFLTGQAGEDEPDKIKIAVIQGNIPQVVKWDEEYEEEILDIYVELSIEAKESANPSLVIWPETSYPGYVDENLELFRKIEELSSHIKIPLLIGGLDYKNGEDYNSAFLILPDGGVKQIYNKLHLVPFGEYIPLKKVFFFLNGTTPEIGNFSRGEEYTIFEIPNSQFPISNKFAVLICFEDLFPDLARRFTKEGVNFLVNITNDAHFHGSPALWQHFTHSVFRAVENRRPMVRAANNGVSGFIDSYGRIIQILNEDGKAVNVRGFATTQISFSPTKTFYTRFGNLFVYLNVLYLVILLMISVRVNIKKL